MLFIDVGSETGRVCACEFVYIWLIMRVGAEEDENGREYKGVRFENV